jgi:gliding motility-associated-like protein
MPKISHLFLRPKQKNDIRWILCASMIVVNGALLSQTVLLPGDLALLSLNANNRLCNTSANDNDVISFVCFKDILPGTKIDITDNGWERALPNQWGNSEGFISMTRIGPTIKAGTVITLQFPPMGMNTYQAIAPDAAWNFVQGTLNPIHLNSAGEQLYFMQGGTWNNPDTIFLFLHRATYEGGRILFGVNTKSTWTSFINNSQESGLHPLAKCLHIAPQSGAWDFLSYTGDLSPATKGAWAQRLRSASNWKTYTACSQMPVLPTALQVLPDSISFHCKSCRGCGPFTDTLSFKLPATGGPYKVTLTSGKDTIRLSNLSSNSKSPVFVDSTRTITLAAIEDGQGCPLNFTPIPPLTIEVSRPQLPVSSLNLPVCAQADGNGAFPLSAADTVFTQKIPGYRISWFLDSTLRQPIENPGSFSSSSRPVFALLSDVFCPSSKAAKVNLEVLPLPEAIVPASTRLCGQPVCLSIPLQLKGKAPFTMAYSLQAPNGTLQPAQQSFNNLSNTWNLCLPQPEFQRGLVNLQYRTLTDANGCTKDLSEKRTAISVRIPSINEIRRTLCQGDAIIVNGKVYNENNPRDSVLLPGAASGGCDSLIIIDLSYYPPLSAGLIGDTSACPGQEFVLKWQLEGGNLFDVFIREDEVIKEIRGVKNGDELRILTSKSILLSIVSVQSQDNRCEIRPFSAYALNVNNLNITAQAIPKFGGTAVSCHNAADGESSARVSGGVSPYRILWSNGATSETISGLPAGIYRVTVTDAKGCQHAAQATVTQPAPITANLETDVNRCAQESGRLVLKQISGGTGPFLYAIAGQEFKRLERLPLTLRNLPPGISILRIQDANSCSANFSFDIPPVQQLTADLGPDLTIASGDSVFVRPQFNFNPVKISWTPLVTPSASRPQYYILRPAQTTTFQIEATDSSGCTAVDALTVFVEQRNSIFVPNAFSPNGDNINDGLEFFAGPEIARFRSLRIYTRWGAQVFEVSDIVPGDSKGIWDGAINGQPAPPGVYLYQMTLEGKDGKITKLNGDVVLIR